MPAVRTRILALTKPEYICERRYTAFNTFGSGRRSITRCPRQIRISWGHNECLTNRRFSREYHISAPWFGPRYPFAILLLTHI